MNAPWWLWLITLAGLVVVLIVDLVVVDRHPHEITVGEAARWVLFYVGCAIVFGVLLGVLVDPTIAGEFFAGYLTEYSLSVDNLFIFLVIMSAFRVPAIHQHRVLLIGILLALLLRGVLIVAGAAVISRFVAVFYLFGAFLIYTAYRTFRSADDPPDDEFRENGAVRLARRIMPVSRGYHGARSFIREHDRLTITPMLLVILALGSTDLLFALDSIPAVFGLTTVSYLVFAVNVFALMGLRQLYFLIGGLLRRLVYLPIGLAVLLAFIGVKLIFEVLHQDWTPFEAGRQSVPVPVFGPGISLAVVVGVLGLTVLASMIKARRSD